MPFKRTILQSQKHQVADHHLCLLSIKVSDRAEHLGSGLLHRGLKANTDTFIGIFAQNRPEVMVWHLEN